MLDFQISITAQQNIFCSLSLTKMLLEYSRLVSAMEWVLSEGLFIQVTARVFTGKSSLISIFEMVTLLVRKSMGKVAHRGKVALHGSASLFFSIIQV